MDRELQTILNSGEIASMYIGGVSSAKKVVIKEDVELSMVALGAVAPLTAQPLSAGVPTKLTWYDTEIVARGTDITYTQPAQEINIVTAGIYKIMGTIAFEYANTSKVEFCLYVNGVPTGFCNTATGEGAGNTISVPYIGVSSLSAGDVLTIYVEADTSNNLILSRSSVIAEKVD